MLRDPFEPDTPPGSARMADVAQAAGVSLVTVSRAINQPDKVAPKTLAAVRQAVEALGYVPNLMAGSLASNRSRIIAAMVPTISNLVFAETIEALSQALNAGGYQLLLAQTNYQPDDERHVLEAFLGRRVDGVVLMGTAGAPVHRRAGQTSPGGSLAQRLRRAGVPVVQTWDLLADPIDMQVGFSNLALGRAAGAYLTERGHRTVGFIGGDEARTRARLRGLRSAVGAQGGRVVAELAPAPAGI
ncbi:MAG: HTH-type transcriptional regulator GntR [Paracidovorax wautersii]|uniref:HTH-type transcriptional regulator GntR n=1 Tax=Paracidovorax wautersii TaxID=1177982 RepID=A0A7V8FMX8_9BURK|nr:MAG: HTH-type transcriptional regulator GntR [Paracidovorax wautersii]